MRSAVPVGLMGKIEVFSGTLPVVAHPVIMPARAPLEIFKNSLLEITISPPFNLIELDR
jgi:hypothetical protein